MKTIAQFVREGITGIADLQAALQTAMQLEFSTIPPYLCAQWSIDDINDPGAVGQMIQDIVVQEMFHFALAGNMLAAIGGKPQIVNAAFIPRYPTTVLPGGIVQNMPVDLQPLSKPQLQVFMQIEYPEFPPVGLAAVGPATIGAFYTALAAAFNAINPGIDQNAHQVTKGEAVPIKSVADAVDAINKIKGEGEGTPNSPDQPGMNGGRLAHYYVFKEILVGKKWKPGDGFDGDEIPFPTVFPFAPSAASPDPSLAFNKTLSQLLTDLEACWSSGKALSLATMFQLQTTGTALIQQGIRPAFQWAAPAGG